MAFDNKTIPFIRESLGASHFLSMTGLARQALPAGGRGHVA
jgi:hypothetical protein